MSMKVIKKFIFLFLSVLAFPLGAHELENSLRKEAIERILNDAPITAEGIENYVSSALLKTQGIRKKIEAQSIEQMNFDVIREWNKIGKIYFESIALLYGLDAVSQNPLILDSGKMGCAKLHASLRELLADEALVKKLLTYIEKALPDPELSSAEKYYFISFLKQNGSFESDDIKNKISSLHDKLHAVPKDPFTFCLGNAATKESNSETFTVLNWNVCFLPGFLSLTYGGMLPWEHRIDKVVDFLKKSEADILCLQEVFDEEAALKLYSYLKDDYSYFYINIAPENFGLDPNICLGSGLFVASKYEICSPNWTKYNDSWLENIRRGFFDFQVINAKNSAHIVTTHLDPSLSLGSAENFRALQLKQVLEHLEKKKIRNNSGPVIVCGDLNVYWGCSEPSEGIIKKCFFDPYNGVSIPLSTYCDFTGYWCPEYILNQNRKEFLPKPCILDYALVLKSLPSGAYFTHHYVAETKILQANYHEYPEGALSDHHALLTTYFWKSKK